MFACLHTTHVCLRVCRDQQNGIFDGELKQEDHLGDGTQTEQDSELSASRQEGTHKGKTRCILCLSVNVKPFQLRLYL